MRTILNGMNTAIMLILDGNRIQSEYGAMPAHYGRRCLGLHLQHNGKYEQCDYNGLLKHAQNAIQKTT